MGCRNLPFSLSLRSRELVDEYVLLRLSREAISGPINSSQSFDLLEADDRAISSSLPFASLDLMSGRITRFQPFDSDEGWLCVKRLSFINGLEFKID